MIEIVLSWPGWVISVVAGAVAGLVGIGAGLAVGKVRPGVARYLPLALFAIGYAAADRFAVPALMQSDLALCSIATETAKKTTEERAGTKPDAVTTFVETVADCAGKRLSTRYTADATRAEIDPAGFAAVEQAFTADTCGEPRLRRMIAAGWTVEAVYEVKSGEPVVMTAGC
jgi:hypothetical protein